MNWKIIIALWTVPPWAGVVMKIDGDQSWKIEKGNPLAEHA
jgi:hypothetical protein